MRLIDADALVTKYGDYYVEEGPEDGFIGTLKCLVDMQPTIGDWISVNDRLPEKRKAVLAYAPRYNNIWAVVLKDNGWNIWAPVGSKYDPDWDGPITHWMPLPEPPEVKHDG